MIPPLSSFRIQVANGNIRGDTSSVKLKAFHLHEIGAHATSKGLYALAVDWLKAAEKYIYEDQTLDIVMLRNAISDLMKIVIGDFLLIFLIRSIHLQLMYGILFCFSTMTNSLNLAERIQTF